MAKRVCEGCQYDDSKAKSPYPIATVRDIRLVYCWISCETPSRIDSSSHSNRMIPNVRTSKICECVYPAPRRYLPHCRAKDLKNAQTCANSMPPMPPVPGMMSHRTTGTTPTRPEKWGEKTGLLPGIHQPCLHSYPDFRDSDRKKPNFGQLSCLSL
jgi:hypothetical protein